MPYQGTIGRTERERLHGHRGMCIWFTGLSGSGKSTLASRVEEELHRRGVSTYLLDGDHLRRGLSADLGFSDQDRREQIRRAAHVARLFVDAGIVVLSAFISPFESEREMARAQFDPDSFVEVFVDCPLEVCAQRDPKGLYVKARQGVIPQFTGISSPYERPLSPDVTVETAKLSVCECTGRILDAVIPRLRHDSSLGVT